jgi:hypothetical protein
MNPVGNIFYLHCHDLQYHTLEVTFGNISLLLSTQFTLLALIKRADVGL